MKSNKRVNVKLRPFFGYYGGKWRDSLRLYAAPQHDTIVEPFAGSAGYSLRYFHKNIILCDKDPIIYGVWNYLIHASESEILGIPDVPLNGSIDDIFLSQEQRWLVGFWLNRAVAKPRKKPSSWMRSGIRPGSFWGDRVRQTISSQLKYIRHWKVFKCSYEEAPVKINLNGPATWFIDPPYQRAGKHYTHGSKKIDFNALGTWCRSRKGQVMVCENQGANWLWFRPSGDSRSNAGRRTGKPSKEVVWENNNQDAFVLGIALAQALKLPLSESVFIAQSTLDNGVQNTKKSED